MVKYPPQVKFTQCSLSQTGYVMSVLQVFVSSLTWKTSPSMGATETSTRRALLKSWIRVRWMTSLLKLGSIAPVRLDLAFLRCFDPIYSDPEIYPRILRQRRTCQSINTNLQEIWHRCKIHLLRDTSYRQKSSSWRFQERDLPCTGQLRWFNLISSSKVSWLKVKN